jgi:16S rRNA G1207 methylase RsmC
VLQRYPYHPRDPLQAWDAADELILEHFREVSTQRQLVSPLIMNDAWGALAHGMPSAATYTDSYLSARAAEINAGIRPWGDLDEIAGDFDLVVMRVPKNLAFFEDELCRLSQVLRRGTPIACGMMVKHQARGAFDLLEKYIGPVTTSLAKKKARLIFSAFEKAPSASPPPIRLEIEGFPHPFVNPSNLFSREKLDIGTRFFLGHVPAGERVLDLGCANGIVGIQAKRQSPSARITFSDESWMAIRSARANYEAYFSDPANFVWTHAFEGGASGAFDLVLCNPPFHQGQTVGTQVAHQMFRDAHRALAPGGRLRVIGNSHLDYPSALRRIFGNSRKVAQNGKFTIAESEKNPS